MDDVERPASEPDVVAPRASSSAAHPSASFGPQLSPNNLLVNVTTDNLNIHPSSISALQRLAETSPAIASKVIDSTDKAVAIDGKKYSVAAVCAAVVALAIIAGAVTVIVTKGVWAGLFFFFACAAAVALLTVAFTGKAQDLSWTVGLIPGRGGDKAPDSRQSDEP